MRHPTISIWILTILLLWTFFALTVEVKAAVSPCQDKMNGIDHTHSSRKTRTSTPIHNMQRHGRHIADHKTRHQDKQTSKQHLSQRTRLHLQNRKLKRKKTKTHASKEETKEMTPEFHLYYPYGRKNISVYRKGKVYIVAHQDWYSQYRRLRGPNGVMRKLTLESPRRKKVMLTFAPTATGEGGNIGTVVEDEDVEEEDKGRSTGTRAKSGDTSTDGEDDDTDDGDSEEDDDDDDDDDDDEDEDESESREDGAIQAIKKPKFVGVPRPVSIRHAGLIPKARSGSNDRRGCNPRRALLRTIALSMVATWSLS